MTKTVHEAGDLYDPADLIKKIAGERINVNPYLKYLDQKYAWVYDY